jgi:hypothetical protein
MSDSINEVPKIPEFIYPNMKVRKWHILNYLIHKHDYQSYLEIGTRNTQQNYDKIHLSENQKESIEPFPPQTDSPQSTPTYQETSDEAFKRIHKTGKKYDLIYIDGLHLEEQVDRDIKNSLKALNPNGTIVLHDCNPLHEFLQRENYEVNGTYPQWNGTVWKSIVKFNTDSSHTHIARVVDTDWGCGIIQPQSKVNSDLNPKPKFQPEMLTYQYLEQNRQTLLNLISTTYFRKYY